MAGRLCKEELCHAERAAGGLCCRAVIHQRKPLFRYFAQVNLPSTAHQLIGVNIRGEAGLLRVLLVITVAVTVAAAFAAVFAATVTFSTANSFGHSESGCRLGGREVASLELDIELLLLRDAGLLLMLRLLLGAGFGGNLRLLARGVALGSAGACGVCCTVG